MYSIEVNGDITMLCQIENSISSLTQKNVVYLRLENYRRPNSTPAIHFDSHYTLRLWKSCVFINFILSAMKQKHLLIASIVTISLFISSVASAQWEDLGAAGDGGITDAIAVSGTNLFSGNASGGVFHSTDNGTSWIEWTGSNNGMPTTAVYALATMGTNLFAGIGDQADTGGGAFLSTDGGASWIPAGLANNYVYAIAAIGTNLFAATPVVYLSTDSGASWRMVLPYGASSFAVSGTDIFVGTSSGVFLSPHNGTSWAEVNNGLRDSNVIALASSGQNLVVSTGKDVFISTNAGTSWTSGSSGLSDAYFVYSLTTIGTNFFAGTENGVYLSTNNGTGWTSASTGLPASAALGSHTYVYSLASNSTYLFAGIDQGQVYRIPISEIINNSSIAEPRAISDGMQIYPNPTTGLLHIESTSNDIVITDLLGRIRMRAKAVNGDIDMSILPQGAYYISDGNSRAEFVKE
jgi:hypothetical protein